jgi:hypothetical protein
MAVDFLQFLAQFIIAGFLVRFAAVKLAGTPWGNALAFIH